MYTPPPPPSGPLASDPNERLTRMEAKLDAITQRTHLIMILVVITLITAIVSIVI